MLLLGGIVVALFLIYVFIPEPPPAVHREGFAEFSEGDKSADITGEDGTVALVNPVPSHNKSNLHDAEDGAVALVNPLVPEPETGVQEGTVPKVQKPQLVLVIDDVGYNKEDIELFLSLPVPMTFAVLPQLDYSEYSARRVLEEGQELIMHLPMESQGGQKPGPGTLTEQMSGYEIRRELELNDSSVPGISGMNNHMGSAGTENARIVREVLEFARGRGYFFLDSRTTANSVVPGLVAEYSVPFVERDVFLDNVKDSETILQYLNQGKTIARNQGSAVMIGHVGTGELAAVLLENYRNILNEGYEFSTLSALVFAGEQ